MLLAQRSNSCIYKSCILRQNLKKPSDLYKHQAIHRVMKPCETRKVNKVGKYVIN